MLFFEIKYTEAILSNSTRKLLRFEIAKVLIALLINKLIVSFIIIFGTFSFKIRTNHELNVICNCVKMLDVVICVA